MHGSPRKKEKLKKEQLKCYTCQIILHFTKIHCKNNELVQND